ncbi:hypothetical protein EZS27_030519 [termite gut metagenome]|uniref:Shedu protein SduA C-terminal domain-containing protein n=1 Tax=termite gut metagenome TaxID=433724 RepID=A0A5J4QEX6_9ZZZZ
MPQGFGKTIISICSIQKLFEISHFKKVAYVSKTRAIIDNFRYVANEYEITNLVSINLYTYDKLLKSIDNEEINRNEFDIIIFEDYDHHYITILNKIAQYFDSFNIYFSNTKLSYRQKELLGDNGSIYELSLIDAVNLQIQNFILSGEIDASQILELNYKKQQVGIFNKLLNDDDFFRLRAKEFSGRDEAVWQDFFEKNKWIFGFSLNYTFNTSLDGKKFEQIVNGYSINGNGKRVDVLLQTTGIIKTLCFGEIKTHQTPILKNLKNPYRVDSWSISDELAGGISQLHKAVQKSLENFKSTLPSHDNGYKLYDSIYLYKPKSFLIIGTLREFKNEKGEMHEERFSSFELFRRSISDIEIITFDELYERAYAIVNKKWKD